MVKPAVIACVVACLWALAGVVRAAEPAAGKIIPARLAFACKVDNDLYAALLAGGVKCPRYDAAASAVAKAPRGSGVLILADGYPDKTTDIPEAVYAAAAAKKLRLCVEYPSSLPADGEDKAAPTIGKPAGSPVERVVVASDFFGPEFKAGRIASINGLRYLPIKSDRSHLVAARVAGFDRAVFGLPDKTSPILFQVPGRDVMVATTCLSRFVTGRYAPQDACRSIWGAILAWSAGDADGGTGPATWRAALKWTPIVRATYTRDEPLPADAELRAIRRSAAWYAKSKMIIHPSFNQQVVGKNFVESLPAEAPMGDGSLGSMEAVLSVIHSDGSQRISTAQRGDCICETAMALALGGKVLKEDRLGKVAANLLDYYLLKSDARKKQRGDPNHGAYGLIAWGITNPSWYKANYGDDNARQMLGTLAVAGVENKGRWDEAMMMCLLANLRTTGQLGFRGDRIDIGALAGGWRRYFDGRRVNYAPHFEAYLWACYLWAYEHTHDKLFLDRARTALKMTMAKYTDGWRWTNGLAQEKARIILPLAWLVRVDDTPENRAMLRKAVGGLIALQDKCGAIREQLGLPGHGRYPPPRSNAAYGTNEASLIAANGDPVADLLYTTNFAFLGLHEAAAATGDKDIAAAENKLAEFLCRIQVTSDAVPQVDGGWCRAFDFGRWELWGCNADAGWGAWAIESGWTQGWITAVFAMRQMKTSLWDLTADSKVERFHDALRKQMLPGVE